MFVVRVAQLSAFEKASQEEFGDEVARSCRALSPHLCEALGAPALRCAIHQAVIDAAAHGFTHRGPVRLYVELTLLFGRGFDTDPQYPWAAEQLARDELLYQLLRAEALFASASAWLEQVRPLDPKRAREAALRLAAIEGAPAIEPDSALRQRLAAEARSAMVEIHPEKCAHLGGELLDRLAAFAVAKAWDDHGLRAPRSIRRAALLMFAFGHRCGEDLFHPWIGELFGGGDA
ncbi:hypothetical protein [Sorangium sp. So ce385]|uniref:hypothetical protein n=1 Tax=Sorangium sp. So ce385 TaxID=3133308 RepID=UPI003F5C2319